MWPECIRTGGADEYFLNLSKFFQYPPRFLWVQLDLSVFGEIFRSMTKLFWIFGPARFFITAWFFWISWLDYPWPARYFSMVFRNLTTLLWGGSILFTPVSKTGEIGPVSGCYDLSLVEIWLSFVSDPPGILPMVTPGLEARYDSPIEIEETFCAFTHKGW